MSMRIRLQAALSVALLASTQMAAADPTVSTLAGNTRVALSSTFLGAVSALGVDVSPTYPGRIRGTEATFPIPTGEIDLGTLKGEVAHNGGLRLQAGDTIVDLSSYVIDTTGEAPVLTGLVKLNDSVVGRLPLFDLTLVSAPIVTGIHARIGSVQINDVDVRLTEEAAAALNDIFNVTAFSAGIPIGTAKVKTYFYEPSP